MSKLEKLAIRPPGEKTYSCTGARSGTLALSAEVSGKENLTFREAVGDTVARKQADSIAKLDGPCCVTYIWTGRTAHILRYQVRNTTSTCTLSESDRGYVWVF